MVLVPRPAVTTPTVFCKENCAGVLMLHRQKATKKMWKRTAPRNALASLPIFAVAPLEGYSATLLLEMILQALLVDQLRLR